MYTCVNIIISSFLDNNMILIITKHFSQILLGKGERSLVAHPPPPLNLEIQKCNFRSQKSSCLAHGLNIHCVYVS